MASLVDPETIGLKGRYDRATFGIFRLPRRLLTYIMAARAEPLSIESLLQKQKAEKDAASKVCIFIIHHIPTTYSMFDSQNSCLKRNVPKSQ